jgi:hypothetical protein
MKLFFTKRVLFLFLPIGIGIVAFAWPIDVPQAVISNNLIRARLYLPDEKRGYYQGARFDWSGVIPELEYKGHRYFGQWFDQYDPKIHDAITGPVQAFTPMGYADAKPGEDFVVIGVGALRKPDEPRYHFANAYEITNAGQWTVRTGKDYVAFTQELTSAAGYAYTYHKTVRLPKGKPELVLEHRLKNNGKRTIETSVYNHNFFMIDGQPTGPAILTTFPFRIQTDGLGRDDLAQARGNQVVYLRELQQGEHVFSSNLRGYGNSARDYNIKIENRKSGAGVGITGNRPLSQLAFWASATTSCPEPYIQVRAEPGAEFTWKITYTFYTFPPSTEVK